jgi:quercetin dioxygenase-like cupin family protein
MERYSWDEVPREELNSLMARQVVHTPSMTILRATFRRGAISPVHQHVHEQVTMLLSGRVRVEVGGDETVLGPGELIRLPSNIPHLVEALEDSVGIDVFTPARTDWQ